MLTLERVKELINDSSISDEEIKQIRDEYYTLAEIIFEYWQYERANKCLNHSESISKKIPF